MNTPPEYGGAGTAGEIDDTPGRPVDSPAIPIPPQVHVLRLGPSRLTVTVIDAKRTTIVRIGQVPPRFADQAGVRLWLRDVIREARARGKPMVFQRGRP